MKRIVIHKNRTNRVLLSLGRDVSMYTFSSKIRSDKDVSSEELASWNTSFVSDGSDGQVFLTLTPNQTVSLEHSSGYMDVKMQAGEEVLNAFDEILEVIIKDTITE